MTLYMNERLQKGAREAPSAQELYISLQTPSAMKHFEPAWCLLHLLSKGHGEREANTNCAPAGLGSQCFQGKSNWQQLKLPSGALALTSCAGHCHRAGIQGWSCSL